MLRKHVTGYLSLAILLAACAGMMVRQQDLRPGSEYQSRHSILIHSF